MKNPPCPQSTKRLILPTPLGRPPQVPVKQGKEWKFSFVPKQGTGTHEIIASDVVEVKEKDTSTLAKVFTVGSTTAIVKPGLKILSRSINS